MNVVRYLRGRKDRKEKYNGGEWNGNPAGKHLHSSRQMRYELLEMTSEVRIGSTPEVIANQTPDIIAQFQCELIITLIYIYLHYTRWQSIIFIRKWFDPMLLVDEEDIREDPVIIVNQQGNADVTEWNK